MNGPLLKKWSVAVLCALGSSGWPLEAKSQTAAVDFALESTTGVTRTLRSERGRVVVVFYEGRDNARDNEDFKRTLHRFIQDNSLDEEVTAYAIADVSSVSSLVRGVVRSVVRRVAEEHGIELLLDWSGGLQEPPFGFQPGAANTAIIDRAGRIAWRHHGVIDDDSRRSFYSAFRAELRR